MTLCSLMVRVVAGEMGKIQVGVGGCGKKRDGCAKESAYTFHIDMMSVEDRLAKKRGAILLRISILLITDALSAEFVVECILGWEAGLDKGMPRVHVRLWV